MKFEAKRVCPNEHDFKQLVKELNAYLKTLTNDSGQSSFSPEAFNPGTDGCIIVYSNGLPVACGLFRHHELKICELKRMYSKLKGAGSYLINELEVYAVSKGYHQAVLSTRTINATAIDFYRRHDYVECNAYGKYVGERLSICLCKSIYKK